LFGLLASSFYYKALVRSAKRTWGWGRGGQIPMSRVSYAVWASAFTAIMFLVGFKWPSQPLPIFWWLLASFIAIMIAGAIDSYRYQPPKAEDTQHLRFRKRKRRRKKYIRNVGE
jgi:hypothetical protein